MIDTFTRNVMLPRSHFAPGADTHTQRASLNNHRYPARTSLWRADHALNVPRLTQITATAPLCCVRPVTI